MLCTIHHYALFNSLIKLSDALLVVDNLIMLVSCWLLQEEQNYIMYVEAYNTEIMAEL